jgi:hypothetical protein
MTAAPDEIRPKHATCRIVPLVEISSRMSRCRMVVDKSPRPDETKDILLSIAKALETRRAWIMCGFEVKARTRTTVPREWKVDLQHVEDDAGGQHVEIRSIAAILRHAALAPKVDEAQAKEVMGACLTAGDAHGLRRGGTTLGASSATAWSDAKVAGHGGGWTDADDDASDMPTIHLVKVAGNKVSIAPMTLLDRPSKLMPPVMESMRILRAWPQSGMGA